MSGTINDCDLRDDSIKYCPICGSKRIRFEGGGYYYCKSCGEDFTYDDCEFDDDYEQIEP